MRLPKFNFNPTVYKIIAIPLLALFALGVFYFIGKSIGLPQDEEILAKARGLFEEYGLAVVFISAIVEALLFVGLYYPGSLVIFLGVILAKSPTEAVLVILTTSVGFFIACVSNYALGRHGWYRLFVKLGLEKSLGNARRRLLKHGPRSIFVSYFIPNLAAFTSTAAGILRLSWRTFIVYSLIAILVWNTVWGTLVYLLGPVAFTLIGVKAIVILILGWMAFSIIKSGSSGDEEDSFLEIVDENGKVTGKEKRSIIHKKGLLHMESHVWFYTRKGEIIFQLRSKDKDIFPDLLAATVGGHVEIGMDYLKTALKETEEETGVKIAQSDLTFIAEVRGQSHDSVTENTNNVKRAVYAYRFLGSLEDLCPEKDKICRFEAWDIDRVLNLSEAEKKLFIPSMYGEKSLAIYRKIKELID